MIKTQLFIQLITAAAGSIGFGLLFHIRKRYLGLVGIGGMIGWLAYVFFAGIWEGVFLPSLAAGFIVDIYAEILARVCKETSTSFFVTSIIPLVPGSTLFYCMSSIVEGNSQMALMYGRDTFYFALGIARYECSMVNMLFRTYSQKKTGCRLTSCYILFFSISSACGLFASIP